MREVSGTYRNVKYCRQSLRQLLLQVLVVMTHSYPGYARPPGPVVAQLQTNCKRRLKTRACSTDQLAQGLRPCSGLGIRWKRPRSWRHCGDGGKASHAENRRGSVNEGRCWSRRSHTVTSSPLPSPLPPLCLFGRGTRSGPVIRTRSRFPYQIQVSRHWNTTGPSRRNGPHQWASRFSL